MWKLVVLGGLLGVAGAMGYGMALPAEGFWTSGERYADWYWLNPQCEAQWDFLSLPVGDDSHIAVEAFLCLSLPNGSAPAELKDIDGIGVYKAGAIVEYITYNQDATPEDLDIIDGIGEKTIEKVKEKYR